MPDYSAAARVGVLELGHINKARKGGLLNNQGKLVSFKSKPVLEFLNNLGGLGIGLSYRPARPHRLEQLIPWILGSLKVKKFGLCIKPSLRNTYTVCFNSGRIKFNFVHRQLL